MSDSKRRRSAAKDKPTAPDDFPLWWHPSGRWCRKVKGKAHYFGKDPDAALVEWLRVKDYLLAGRRPPPPGDVVTVADVADGFLNSRRRKREAGELKAETFDSYHATMGVMVGVFGDGRAASDLGPEDFAQLRAAFAAKHGPTMLARDVQEVRTAFKWAVEADVIPNLPKYGPDFRRPSARVLRTTRNATVRTMDAAELRAMIEAASPVLRCFMYLGINAAFGPHDFACLPRAAVDLRKGWVAFARPKTGVPRRAKLWPETIRALQEYEAIRPDAARPEYEAHFFLNRFGQPYVGQRRSAVRTAFRALGKKLGIYRRGTSPYSLRHSFRHVADGSLDQVAAAVVMGHLDTSIAGTYRGDVPDSRVEAVCEHVRAWLFAPEPAAGDEDRPATVPFRRKTG